MIIASKFSYFLLVLITLLFYDSSASGDFALISVKTYGLFLCIASQIYDFVETHSSRNLVALRLFRRTQVSKFFDTTIVRGGAAKKDTFPISVSLR